MGEVMPLIFEEFEFENWGFHAKLKIQVAVLNAQFQVKRRLCQLTLMEQMQRIVLQENEFDQYHLAFFGLKDLGKKMF